MRSDVSLQSCSLVAMLAVNLQNFAYTERLAAFVPCIAAVTVTLDLYVVCLQGEWSREMEYSLLYCGGYLWHCARGGLHHQQCPVTFKLTCLGDIAGDGAPPVEVLHRPADLVCGLLLHTHVPLLPRAALDFSRSHSPRYMLQLYMLYLYFTVKQQECLAVAQA